MPYFDAQSFLSAMESLNGEVPDIETIPEAGPDMPPEQTIPPETTQENAPIISNSDKSAILMMLMREALGPKVFYEFASEYAVDLEVYGIIDSADALRNTVEHMKSSSASIGAGIHTVAVLMARNAGAPEADAFMAAENAEDLAMQAIMETYGDAAKGMLTNILSDYRNLVNTIEGDASTTLRYTIDQILSEITNAHSPEVHSEV